jgi:hypothetical protein
VPYGTGEFNMKIRNVHERELPMSPRDAQAILRTLASEQDRLWPTQDWPPMRFDGGLQLGAHGGHGPIAYSVERIEPERVVFRLRPMRGLGRGLVGWHGYELQPTKRGLLLRHVLEAELTGGMRLKWPLVIRPLHDALIEDSLDLAEGVSRSCWSGWVRLLRRILGAPTDKGRPLVWSSVRFRRLLGGPVMPPSPASGGSSAGA